MYPMHNNPISTICIGQFCRETLHLSQTGGNMERMEFSNEENKVSLLFAAEILMAANIVSAHLNIIRVARYQISEDKQSIYNF